MLRLLRRTRALSAVLTVTIVLAWVGGLSAKVVHEITARHTVCEDHRQLVEDDDAGDADHEHGCDLQGISTQGAAPEPLAVPAARTASADSPVVALLACVIAPRGPPLAYAPKTSPPLPA